MREGKLEMQIQSANDDAAYADAGRELVVALMCTTLMLQSRGIFITAEYCVFTVINVSLITTIQCYSNNLTTGWTEKLKLHSLCS